MLLFFVYNLQGLLGRGSGLLARALSIDAIDIDVESEISEKEERVDRFQGEVVKSLSDTISPIEGSDHSSDRGIPIAVDFAVKMGLSSPSRLVRNDIPRTVSEILVIKYRSEDVWNSSVQHFSSDQLDESKNVQDDHENGQFPSCRFSVDDPSFPNMASSSFYPHTIVIQGESPHPVRQFFLLIFIFHKHR